MAAVVVADDGPASRVEGLRNVCIPTGVLTQTMHQHDQPVRFVCRVVIKPQLQPVASRDVRRYNAINHGVKYAFCAVVRVMRHSKRTKNLG